MQQDSQQQTYEPFLEQLQASHENMAQIAAYCRQFYAAPDMPASDYQAAVEQTKTYALQGVSSVAYLIEQVA